MTDLRVALLTGLGFASKRDTGAVASSAPSSGTASRSTFASGHAALRVALDALKIADIIAVFGAGVAADRLQHAHNLNLHLNPVVLVAAMATPVLLQRMGAYDQAVIHDRGRLLAAGASGAALLFAAIAVLNGLQTPPDGLAKSSLWMWLTFSLALGMAARAAFLGATGGRRSVRFKEAVALVGATPLSARLVDHFRANAHSIELIGVFEDRHPEREPLGFSIDGSIEDLLALGRARPLSQIVLTLPAAAQGRTEDLMVRLKTLSVDIVVLPDHPSVGGLGPSNADLAGLPVLRFAERPLKGWKSVVKSLEDVVIGALILLFLAPLMVAISILIKLDSAGPVLFRQLRHGLNNSEITVFKFRTMYADAHDAVGERQTQARDSRVTRAGRFLRASSLDELPQILNVLKGDMSLVGPRAHPVHMRTENRLGADILPFYGHRHRVKPGITGWAQVHGLRGPTRTFEDLRQRVVLDLEYIERWSLWLDIKIIALTPLRLLIDKAE